MIALDPKFLDFQILQSISEETALVSLERFDTLSEINSQYLREYDLDMEQILKIKNF